MHLLTATGRCADVGRRAALETTGRRLAGGPAAPAPAAAGGQEAGQGEQGLEEVGHVAVLLRRALQHFRPARMVRETGIKRVAYFSGMAA